MSCATNAGALARNPSATERMRLEEIRQRVELAQQQMDRGFDTLEKLLLQMSDARAQLTTIAGVVKEGACA